MRREVLVPGLAAGAVAALVAGVALVGSGGGAGSDGDDLVPLRIGAASGGVVPLGSVEAKSSDTSMPVGGGGYVLTGTLSDEAPADEPVRRFDRTAVDVDEVEALAAALGLSAAPTLEDGDWVVDSGELGTLRVQDEPGNSWFFSRQVVGCYMPKAYAEAPDTAVSDCVLPAAEPSAPAVPEDQVRAAAEPVLGAVGLDVSDATVETGGPEGWLSLNPVVDGRETWGWSTDVSVDAQGVVSASGHLGEPTRSAPYPLISTQDAFDQLAAQPVPEIAMLCPDIAPTPEPALDPVVDPIPCGPAEPIEVSGARLVLAPFWEGEDGPLLAPTWLFFEPGWGPYGPSHGPTVVAVSPDYIADPSDDPADPGTSDDPDQPVPAPVPDDSGTAVPGSPGSGSGSGSDGSPGTTEPAPGDGPVTDPEWVWDGKGQPVEVAAVLGDGLVVVVRGSGICPPEVKVVESVDAVTFEELPPPNTICTDDLAATKVEISLDAPLGDRRVLNSAGIELAVPGRS